MTIGVIGVCVFGVVLLLGGVLMAPGALRLGAEEAERRARMHTEWRHEEEYLHELPAKEVFRDAFITNADIIRH